MPLHEQGRRRTTGIINTDGPELDVARGWLDAVRKADVQSRSVVRIRTRIEWVAHNDARAGRCRVREKPASRIRDLDTELGASDPIGRSAGCLSDHIECRPRVLRNRGTRLRAR